jgi:hypothetical protein
MDVSTTGGVWHVRGGDAINGRLYYWCTLVFGTAKPVNLLDDGDQKPKIKDYYFLIKLRQTELMQ